MSFIAFSCEDKDDFYCNKMTEITLPNSIREKMLKDEVAYTLSVKLVRSVELPMMAKTAGFDGILIDMEHSAFDLDTTSKHTPARIS